MPDATEKKWYQHDRVQGLGIMVLGVAMLFNPVTHPAGIVFITFGAGWGSAGAKNAIVRQVKKITQEE